MHTLKRTAIGYLAIVLLPSLAIAENTTQNTQPAATEAYELSKYPDATKIFTDPAIYQLSKATLKNPDAAEKALKEKKGSAFKWREGKKFIITIVRLGSLPFVVFISIKLFTKFVAKMIGKRLGLPDDALNPPENVEFYQNLLDVARQGGQNLLESAVQAMFLSFISQFILRAASCYIILGYNPIPDGILGKAFFFLGGYDICIAWAYLKFIKANFFPSLYMPAKLLITGNMPFDPLEEGQIAYIRVKGEMSTNQKLCASIEKGFAQAYLDPQLVNKTLQKTREAIILFFATYRKYLSTFVQGSTQDVLKRAEKSYKNYPLNVKKPLVRFMFGLIEGKGSEVLLLYGPPGTGKTYSILQMIDIIGGGQAATANLEGITPEGFRGTSEKMGEIERAILEAGQKGYVLILQIDEFEKPLRKGSKYASEMETVLLKFMDTNEDTFYSPYFDAHFPKPPLIACTANALPDSDPLVDRLELISREEGYTQEEKEDILGIHQEKGGKLQEICETCKIDRQDLEPEDIEAIKQIVKEDTSPGARKMQQAIKAYIREQQMAGRLQKRNISKKTTPKRKEVALEKIELDAPERCTICQENIEKEAAKTSCKHHFHEGCINKWLEDHDDCPNCRKKLRN